MSRSVPTAPAWLPLPIDADEGFPQSFRLALDSGLYRVGLYVNVSEELLQMLGSQALLELPREDAFLVLRIARESDAGEPRTIFQRKVVPALDYRASELTLRFDELTIARANLNAPGPHGSTVTGRVASAWAS